MTIRDLENRDRKILQEIHEASGFDYRFPDLDDPLFVVKKVDEERNVARQGIAIKIEATVYLWVDTSWGTPSERWERLQQLVEEAKKAAWDKGLDTLTCVVPPELEKRFAKRLRKIGMTRDREWPKWSFDLNEYVPRA